MAGADELNVSTSDGTLIRGEMSGRGHPVVLLHGLTATRRYVVMGSRALERAGHRVVLYDARGHGHSSPASDRRAYDYARLSDDLLELLDFLEFDRVLLAGASMGAHTALRVALSHPERVAGLCLITPAFDPDNQDDPVALARWEALADGLRSGGVAGFLDAYDFQDVPEQWRETLRRVILQRLQAHEHIDAVADALSVVPHSKPFQAMSALGSIAVPTVVVASRDEADPGHPLATGERYASSITGAQLVLEQEGQSPIAWQGGQLSRVIGELSTQLTW